MWDESDEKRYISFSAREVQPATKPAEGQVKKKVGLAIRPSPDGSDGGVECSLLAICSAC